MSDDEEMGKELAHKWSHLLVDHVSMNDLQQPIKSSARIRYTCLSVSCHYIALGSTTGAIYIFTRDSLKYVYVLPGDKETSVVQLCFNPDDSVLAYGNSKGQIVIMRLRIEQRAKPEKLRSTSDHKGATITSMCWNGLGNKLFTGDTMGRVSVAKIPTAGTKARDLLRLSSEVIMKLDTAVVQIDAFDDLVIVSTHTRSFLGNTSKEQFTHIGTKPRDGAYGACFYFISGMESATVYCSRPGSRLWEVDSQGNVINTHQLKLLLDLPILPYIDARGEDFAYPTSLGLTGGPQSLNFPKLLTIADQFLLTWNDRGIYIFDPVEVKVILWNNQIKGIQDIKVHKSEAYILLQDSQVQRLDLQEIPKAISKLCSKKKWLLAGQISVCYKATVMTPKCRRHVPVAMVMDIRDELDQLEEVELANQVNKLIPDLEIDTDSDTQSVCSSKSGCSYEKLESGIYVVRNRPSSIEGYELKSIDGTEEESTRSQTEDDSDVSSDKQEHNNIAEDRPSRLFMPVAELSPQRSESNVTVTPSKPDVAKTHSETNTFSENLNNIPIIPLTLNTKDGQTFAIRVSPAQEDSKSTKLRSADNDSGSFARDNSSDRNLITNLFIDDSRPSSVDSSEMAYIAPTTDPEPVYAKPSNSIGVKKFASKGKKAKVSHIALDGQQPTSTPGRKIRRSQSSSGVKKAQHTRPSAAASPQSEHKEADHSKQELQHKEIPLLPPDGAADEPETPPKSVSVDDIGEGGEAEQPGKSYSLEVDEVSTEDTSRLTVLDEERSRSPSPYASSVESAAEFEAEGNTVDDTEGRPKTRKLRAVKNKITSKVSNTSKRVSTTTKSIIQTIKDKKNQITTKRDDNLTSPEDAITIVFRKEDAADVNDRESGNTANEVSEITEKDAPSYPKIDTSQLQTLTKETSIRLLDSAVKYNPSKMRVILTPWACCLHRTLQSLHTAISMGDHTPVSEGEDISNGLKIDQPEGELQDKSLIDYNEEDQNDLNTDGIDVKITENGCTEEINSSQCSDGSSVKLESKQPFIDDAFHDAMYVRNPFDIGQDLYSDAAHLAMLCFQLRCRPQSAAESNLEVTQQDIDQGKKTFMPLGLNSSYVPVILEECPVEDSIEHDKDLAQFLRLFFHFFLGSLDKVQKSIICSKGSKKNRWKSLMKCATVWCHGSPEVQQLEPHKIEALFDLLRSTAAHDRATFLGHIQSLYKVVPLRTLEFVSADVAGCMSPLEVLYMCQSFRSTHTSGESAAQDTSTSHCKTPSPSEAGQHFVFYVNSYIKHTEESARSEVIHKLCREEEVREEWLETLLHQDLTSLQEHHQLSCSCGYPRPGSHKILWKHGTTIDDIISQSGTPSQHKHMTFRYGYWLGYVGLCGVLGEREMLQTMVLQLADISLLTSLPECLPKSLNEWKIFLQKRREQEGLSCQRSCAENTHAYPIHCFNCSEDLSGIVENMTDTQNTLKEQHHDWSPSITWENLGLLLVAEFGSERTLQLLNDIDIPKKALSLQFYQSCVASRLLEKQHSQDVQNMLEKLDTYLWSQRQSHIPPQLYAPVLQEKIESINKYSIPPESMFSRVTRTSGAEQTLEDGECHWGVSVHITSDCPGCSLPLTDLASHVLPGTVFLRCGHGYHKACLPHDICIKCLSDKSANLCIERHTRRARQDSQ